MSSVAKTILSSGVALGAVCVFACNGTPAVIQAIIASNVQQATTAPNAGKGCISPSPFVWVPQTQPEGGVITSVGPDTTVQANITVAGGDLALSCSVVPSGNGFNVNAQAIISGGNTPGTFTVSGLFTPRGRDGGDAGAGKPNADGTPIPNIVLDFIDATKHLRQTNCTAQYTEANNGQAGTSLPDVADTYADDKGGRIWVSVFCPSPQSLKTDKPGNDGCETSATFRFENCTSKGP